MKKIQYDVEGRVQINGQLTMSFVDFQEICDNTGYVNPFTNGQFEIYEKGKGLSSVNQEGHISEPDGEKHPEYEIFIKHFDNIQKINNNLNKVKEAKRIEEMPNAQKRRLPLALGGYGTTEEQLEILAADGLDGLRSHRAAVDKKLP